MAKKREESPVDLTKSKFSIDFLLDNSTGHFNQAKHDPMQQPSECLSRSVTPDLDDDELLERISASPSTSSRNGSSNHHHHPNHHRDERRKRPRTAFTGTQIKTLEAEFEKNKYLSVVKRIELAKTLGLSQQQLKVWYQNRRTKWKRKYANDLESMAQQYYNSMGLAGSRPMLIGDRLWIFNSPLDVANSMRRGILPLDGQSTSVAPSIGKSIPSASSPFQYPGMNAIFTNPATHLPSFAAAAAAAAASSSPTPPSGEHPVLSISNKKSSRHL